MPGISTRSFERPERGLSCIRRSLVQRNLLILLALSAVEIVRPALRV